MATSRNESLKYIEFTFYDIKADKVVTAYNENEDLQKTFMLIQNTDSVTIRRRALNKFYINNQCKDDSLYPIVVNQLFIDIYKKSISSKEQTEEIRDFVDLPMERYIILTGDDAKLALEEYYSKLNVQYTFRIEADKLPNPDKVTLARRDGLYFIGNDSNRKWDWYINCYSDDAKLSTSQVYKIITGKIGNVRNTKPLNNVRMCSPFQMRITANLIRNGLQEKASREIAATVATVVTAHPPIQTPHTSKKRKDDASNNVAQQQPIEPLTKRARIDEGSQSTTESDDLAQIIKNAGLENMLELQQDTTLSYNNSIFDDDELDRLITATDASPDEVPDQIDTQINPANNLPTELAFNVDDFFARRVGNIEFNNVLSRLPEVKDNSKIHSTKEYFSVSIFSNSYHYFRKIIKEEANICDHFILESGKKGKYLMRIKSETAKRLKHLYSNYLLPDKSTRARDFITNNALLFLKSSHNNPEEVDKLRKSVEQSIYGSSVTTFTPYQSKEMTKEEVTWDDTLAQQEFWTNFGSL